MTIRLDNIVLTVKDLERSVAFYKEAGFQLLQQHGDEIAIFSIGNDTVRILLHPLRPNLRLPPERAAAIYGFEVNDVDQLHGSFSSKGFTVSEIRDQPWGVREFYLPDPDAHVFTFFKPNN